MTVQSFSGADFSVVLILDSAHLNNAVPQKPFKLSSEMQTITVSSTASVNPVRQLGHRKPACYTRGARTFAGTIIFSVIDKDPFQELFAFDALNSAVRSDGVWHADMMPPFDIIISAANEGGTAGVQVISNVTLTNSGTTYSVDDMYTEVTYTYVAEHVSPFVKNPIYDEFLKLTRRQLLVNRTPDELVLEQMLGYLNGKSKTDENGLIFPALTATLAPGGVSIAYGPGGVSDPVMFQALIESNLLYVPHGIADPLY